MSTQRFNIKTAGSTDPFDEMFSDTHGGSTKEDEDGEVIWGGEITADDDVDECQEPESMNDKDEN